MATSDKDYFQLLDSNVRIWDGMKMSETTVDTWKNDMGINPIQAIDVGALQGDDGDNIFGVPGWGEKTSLKIIKQFGSWEKALASFEKTYQSERVKYPDLNTDTEKGLARFSLLSDKKSEKLRFIYPEITFNMPYTGVLEAFDNGTLKGSKTEIMALMFAKRIKLAYSLKKMDIDMPNLPVFEKGMVNRERLQEYFDYYDIKTLSSSIDVFEL